MRVSGILLPVSSLSSAYGIGTMGKSAYEWIDFLYAAGQRYWQVLPMGQTGYGDSPYQSFSTYAGNPYFIDLELLVEEGLLTKEELESCDFGENPEYAEYEKLYKIRYKVLKKAYERDTLNNKEYEEWAEKEEWLRDYAVYMAIKDSLGGISWQEWPEALKLRDPKALAEAEEALKEEIGFYQYLQFIFKKQWTALKEYAHSKDVEIIGDIPIYVALDSADAWSRPELFDFDEELKPNLVAGCPPDAFSATGQLWGNPLYKWAAHKEEGYAWWIRRIEKSMEYYDVVRIDHFRGFEAFYAIPYGDKTAEFGHWEKGPDYDLFRNIKQKLGKVRLIAEDLGDITPQVHKLLKKCGYPGMKVLQFAFDSGSGNPYLPHQYVKNCIVYTGTHDNDTLMGWRENLSRKTIGYANRYLHIRQKKNWCSAMIDAAMASVADTAIIPVQDYLELGSEARINIPSTLGMNWKWRLLPGALKPELAERIREITERYGRSNPGIAKKKK